MQMYLKIIGLAVILCAMLIADVAANPIGTFYTNQNVYAYPDGPQQGRRLLLKTNSYYLATEVVVADDGVLWLMVLVDTTEEQKLEGWTNLSKPDVEANKDDRVPVFSKIPSADDNLLPTLISRNKIKFDDLIEKDANFEEVRWYKVSYTSNQRLYWVNGRAGVLRLDLDINTLSSMHKELLENKDLSTEDRERLMLGLVSLGDNQWDVLHALGEPLFKNNADNSNPNGATVEMWAYNYASIYFEEGSVIKVE